MSKEEQTKGIRETDGLGKVLSRSHDSTQLPIKRQHSMVERFNTVTGRIRNALKRSPEINRKVAAVQFLRGRKSCTMYCSKIPTCVTSAGLKTFNPEISLEHVNHNEEVRVYIGADVDIQVVRKCKDNSNIRECIHRTLIEIPRDVDRNSLVFIEKNCRLIVKSKHVSESKYVHYRKPSCLLVKTQGDNLGATWYVDASGRRPKIKYANKRMYSRAPNKV